MLGFWRGESDEKKDMIYATKLKLFSTLARNEPIKNWI